MENRGKEAGGRRQSSAVLVASKIQITPKLTGIITAKTNRIAADRKICKTSFTSILKLSK